MCCRCFADLWLLSCRSKGETQVLPTHLEILCPTLAQNPDVPCIISSIGHHGLLASTLSKWRNIMNQVAKSWCSREYQQLGSWWGAETLATLQSIHTGAKPLKCEVCESRKLKNPYFGSGFVRFSGNKFYRTEKQIKWKSYGVTICLNRLDETIQPMVKPWDVVQKLRKRLIVTSRLHIYSIWPPSRDFGPSDIFVISTLKSPISHRVRNAVANQTLHCRILEFKQCTTF